MSKYKVGDKVVIRKDLVVDEYYGDNGWDSGMNYLKELPYVEIECDDISGNYDVLDTVNGGYWIITNEMISHKYQPSPTKKQRIEKLESDYKLLNEEHVKLLDTVIKLTEQVNELSNPTPAKTVEKPVVELTPNQKRKQIIDEAKAFVKEVELEYVNVPLHYNVDFKKRTVSAYTDVNLILSTVKCLPEDVFNVHIGKALALAKRYDMKDEIEKFSNAIRPTEKVEGMKVKYERAGDILKIVSNNDDVICGETSHTDSLCAALSRIYDDSNAKY